MCQDLVLLFDSKTAVYHLIYHLENGDILFSLDEITTDDNLIIYELTVDKKEEEQINSIIEKYHIKPPLDFIKNI